MSASRSFPKLDKLKPAHKRPASDAPLRVVGNGGLSMPVDAKTWKAWRMKLGATRKHANALWMQYQEWRALEAQNGPVRRLEVAPWQNWEREFRAWLDEMPRKPIAFLAMVAAAEKRRAAKESIQARKVKGRERFLRRYARRASPAQKIPRQAEHGTGGNDWAQGTREVRGRADSGGSYVEVG